MLSEERLSRFFDDEALLYLRGLFSGKEQVELCDSLLKKNIFNNGESIKDYFRTIFKDFNSVQFNSFDEDMFPFNKMPNSEKMYFHNSFWIETLGVEHFREYKSIVKLRPDLKLDDGVFFDQIDYKSKTIYVENYGGWIFRDWGFGIGDQIISGLADDVINVLLAHGEKKLSSRLLRHLNQTDYSYSGHRNCGYLAYMHGLDCDVSQVRPLEICNIKKFNVDDIQRVLEVEKTNS
jgi:hypothetical protein